MFFVFNMNSSFSGCV